jgi:hypothetical protein
MSPPESLSTGRDVIVVGAGAAGLLAAARSAIRGRATLLLEKNRKAGVKILMSGGTRCNITHDCDARGIIAGFGSAGRFLHSPLAALGPRELVALFESLGLATKVEPGGKVFPRSDRAADVLNALLDYLHESGAELARDESVTEIERIAGGFRVATTARRLECEKLVITTGGQSYPGCGTTGDGYAWLASLGHTIRAPRPALAPLTSDEAWIHDLSGVTIPDVSLQVVEVAGDGRPKPLAEDRGSLLFTHRGISGPVALNVSRVVTRYVDPSRIALWADFLPDEKAEALDKQLAALAGQDGKRLVRQAAFEALPRRLVSALATRAGLAEERKAAELSRGERANLVAAVKRAVIRITGHLGFAKAEVTAGGVALDEVDSRSMESKLVPGLYLAGEILDLDGLIGGYNFQAAFSTGWLAGESV